MIRSLAIVFLTFSSIPLLTTEVTLETDNRVRIRLFSGTSSVLAATKF
jgi:hypothetical protein